MTTPDADSAASALDGIRERQALASDASLGFSRINERHDALIKSCYEDVPALLAAVEAALAFHVEAVIEDMQPEPFRYCRTCSGHPAWPCPEVAATTAALAGTQRGEDGDHD